MWNQAEDIILGDKLNLYLTSGQTILAYSTNASLSIESETIDVSSKFSCRWNSNLNGKASYTITADALYCKKEGAMSFDTLLDLMLVGEPVEWYLGQEEDFEGACEENPHTLDTSKPFKTGKAVITSLSLDASQGEIASCSTTLTGAGEIQKGTQA